MRVRPALILLCLIPGMATAQTFTTVDEVKPILTATQGSWIAVRNWQGQDLVYFTQVESWRCGLREIRYSVNGAAEAVKPMEPCYTDAPSPNAFQDSAHQPYVSFPAGSVETVSVTLVYSDGSTTEASFNRAQVELR
ncbi:hypothetical protein [Tropicimonas sp. S265A]|uniref:hypothetical protein n=1 Tax=Tropicimonas sp. S265A TaxID=3415134 RepID=UPI003C7A2521